MENPRIVITMEGGLITGISSDQPARTLILDFDAHEYGDDDDVTTIIDIEGKESKIFQTCPYQSDVNPDFVDHFFKQF